MVVEHESRPWNRDELHQLSDWDLDDIYIDEETRIGQRARAPRCECSNCTHFDTVKGSRISVTFGDYAAIDPKETEQLSEHQFLLCASHMCGFILKDRAYGEFPQHLVHRSKSTLTCAPDLLDVSGLENPRIVENAIDQLVMRAETNKDKIKAIVKTHGGRQRPS